MKGVDRLKGAAKSIDLEAFIMEHRCSAVILLKRGRIRSHELMRACGWDGFSAHELTGSAFVRSLGKLMVADFTPPSTEGAPSWISFFTMNLFHLFDVIFPMS